MREVAREGVKDPEAPRHVEASSSNIASPSPDGASKASSPGNIAVEQPTGELIAVPMTNMKLSDDSDMQMEAEAVPMSNQARDLVSPEEPAAPISSMEEAPMRNMKMQDDPEEIQDEVDELRAKIPEMSSKQKKEKKEKKEKEKKEKPRFKPNLKVDVPEDKWSASTPVEKIADGNISDWDDEDDSEASPVIDKPEPINLQWETWDSPSHENTEAANEEEEDVEMSEESDWDAESDEDESGFGQREDMLLRKYEELLKILKDNDGDVSAVPEGFFDGLEEDEVEQVFSAVQNDLDDSDEEESDEDEDEDEDESEGSDYQAKYKHLLTIMIEGEGDPSAVPEGFFEGMSEEEIEQMFDEVETEMDSMG